MKCSNCQKSYNTTKTKAYKNAVFMNVINNYCSIECQKEAKQTGELLKCVYCSKEVYKRACDIKKAKRVFCSKSCSASYNNIGKTHSDETKEKIRKKLKNVIRNPNKKKVRTCKDVDKVHCKVTFKTCKETGLGYMSWSEHLGWINRTSPHIDRTRKELYYEDCAFKFNVYHYPEKFDLSLIEKHGWYECYSPKCGKENNTNGVSRDHMVSVMYGYKNGIDPKIISHPANCELVLQRDNISKREKCSISLEELMGRINKWNEEYGNFSI